MNAFEFIILFLSFVYTLALTHLLFAGSRMIRHRRELVLSVPHLLWMLVALANLAANWISSWDFRTESSLSLATISLGFIFAVLNYLMCALVSPDFEGGETYDMKRFHEREGPTYIIASLAQILFAIAANFLARAALDITKWGNENLLVCFWLIPITLALVVKRPWAQVLAPAVLLALTIAYAVIYYPVLQA
jgi:hypothetical protein